MSRVFLLISLCLCLGNCEGQNHDSVGQPTSTMSEAKNSKPYFQDTLYRRFADIIDSTAFKIHFPNTLRSFFNQLRDLEKGNQNKIRISHIGDSHIQADYLTGQLRKHFQQDFGNGGRGLIFPYRMAKTNGPHDYDIYSDVEWKAKRNVFPKIPIDIGVAGISIKTKTRNYKMQIQMDSSDTYDSLVVFHKGPSKNPYTVYYGGDNSNMTFLKRDKETIHHKIHSGENLTSIAKRYKTSIDQIKQWNNMTSNQIFAGKKLKIELPKQTAKRPNFNESLEIIPTRSTYDSTLFQLHLMEPTANLVLQYSGQEGHEINGIYVENNKPGVIYNMIGVNGAKYEHYNSSVSFQDQFQKLNSDLIIVSLGTNESLDNHYESEQIIKQFSLFTSEIKKKNPNVPLLICLHSDLYGKEKPYKNAKRLNEALKAVCRKQEMAYFDIFQFMGGERSMYKWHQKGLANRDLIHLNRLGYKLLGDVLYTAIITEFLQD